MGALENIIFPNEIEFNRLFPEFESQSVRAYSSPKDYSRFKCDLGGRCQAHKPQRSASRGCAEPRAYSAMAFGTRRRACSSASARTITVFNAPFDPVAVIERSHHILMLMDAELIGRDRIASWTTTIADVALYSWIANAPEGRVDFAVYRDVEAWLEGIEALPRFIAFQPAPVGLRMISDRDSIDDPNLSFDSCRLQRLQHSNPQRNSIVTDFFNRPRQPSGPVGSCRDSGFSQYSARCLGPIT